MSAKRVYEVRVAYDANQVPQGVIAGISESRKAAERERDRLSLETYRAWVDWVWAADGVGDWLYADVPVFQ